MTSLLVVLGSLCSFQAFGTDYKEEIDHQLADLVNISSTTATSGGNAGCQKRYENLYKDGTLNVAIGFGYWDNSPNEFVFDQYIANGLRLALVAPCSTGVNVCGFKKQGQSDIYQKTVRGPDGKPNKFTISLTHGTLTTNNVANTTNLRTQQYAKCEAATDKFFREVSRGSEVVMYIGHARDGGGPDFCPPVRDPNKKTDYAWYQKHQPGFKRLLTSMDESRAAGRPNQVVGLYSCYSQKHFHKGMGRNNPDTGYVLSQVAITSVNAINSIVTTLDAVIGHKCGNGFIEGLKLSQSSMTIFGMFTKPSP